jgi:hypothetical protein
VFMEYESDQKLAQSKFYFSKKNNHCGTVAIL